MSGFSPSRRSRLATIARARTRPEEPVAAVPRPAARRPELAAVLGGEVSRTRRGKHWRIVTESPAPVDTAGANKILTDLVPDSTPGPGPWIFFDLETCGFSGTPLMLAGLLVLTGPGTGEGLQAGPACRIIQLLARDYAEECSVLEACLEFMGPRPSLVSFNGKSYDIPFISDRANRFSLRPPVPKVHVDLLHLARRRWKGRFANFRLTTLEARINGVTRLADVPGSQVPERFHQFARDRDPRRIAGVLRHNRHDLRALVDILFALRSSRQGLTTFLT